MERMLGKELQRIRLIPHVSLFLPASAPGAQDAVMNFALSVLRLMCLAWLWPVALLKGSNTQNQRKHKDVYLGENTRHKHAG